MLCMSAGVRRTLLILYMDKDYSKCNKVLLLLRGALLIVIVLSGANWGSISEESPQCACMRGFFLVSLPIGALI